MEKILANISASLVAPKNINQVITSALEEIGKFMGLSRVYMMEASLPKKVLDITYEWCAPNIPSRWKQLWGIPLESLPQWMGPLKENKNIVISDAQNTTFQGVKSPFESPQIQALLIIPIWANDQLYGFISLEDLSHPFNWRDEHIRSLRTIAEIFRRSMHAYQMEQELRKTRDQLEAVFTCIADPLNVVDRSFNVLLCNPARAAIFNSEVQDVVGRKCFEFFHHRHKPCVVCAVSDVFQTGKPSHRLCCRNKTDGSEAWSDVFAFPIYNDQGEVIQAVEFARDITQRKKAEDEIKRLYEALERKVEERTQELRNIQEEMILKEKLALIGQLIGSIGHEFRSSLTVLSGTIYVLKNRSSEESIDDFIEALNDEIHKMSKFVEDLLDFSRTIPPSFQQVDLQSLLQKIIQKISIPSKVHIFFDFPEDFPPAYVDPDHAEQIFYNFVSNAIEAMPIGGTLTISGSEEDSKVVLHFTDTGVGISPINLRKIFTPLFTTKSKGTGLGLSIINMLIRKNKGKIAVDSIPQKGTTFHIFLQKFSITEREGEILSGRDSLLKNPK